MITFKRKKFLGFTVIELMIVIMIVAILTALAYPSYINYVRKSKRGEAQQLLMNWSINQEIWRSNNSAYAGTGDIPAPCSSDGADCDYEFVPSNLGANTFTLTATAISGNDQENDTARDSSISCSEITLDQNGQKLPPACWE
ncbi:type IV pilin protein [Pseudomonadota bacterium]